MKLSRRKIIAGDKPKPDGPAYGSERTQKRLPSRHKDTKNLILLFFLSVLVPLWREEKNFATKNTITNPE
jgi:hypothetical protein